MEPADASFQHYNQGNVDHIIWVTMAGDGRQIAKIMLDGIFDRKGRDLTLKDVYNQKKKEQKVSGLVDQSRALYLFELGI